MTAAQPFCFQQLLDELLHLFDLTAQLFALLFIVALALPAGLQGQEPEATSGEGRLLPTATDRAAVLAPPTDQIIVKYWDSTGPSQSVEASAEEQMAILSEAAGQMPDQESRLKMTFVVTY